MVHIAQDEKHVIPGFSISRRRLLTRIAPAGLAGAVLATVSFPALALAATDGNRDAANARLLHLNQSAYYAAIFEQSSGSARVARHGLTSAQYQQTFNNLTAQGYRLLDVSGYGI
jgi:hypothetical protein